LRDDSVSVAGQYDELELERDMEHFVEPEEARDQRRGRGDRGETCPYANRFDRLKSARDSQ
jgi:hypothetical protein